MKFGKRPKDSITVRMRRWRCYKAAKIQYKCLRIMQGWLFDVTEHTINCLIFAAKKLDVEMFVGEEIYEMIKPSMIVVMSKQSVENAKKYFDLDIYNDSPSISEEDAAILPPIKKGGCEVQTGCFKRVDCSESDTTTESK